MFAPSVKATKPNAASRAISKPAPKTSRFMAWGAGAGPSGRAMAELLSQRAESRRSSTSADHQKAVGGPARLAGARTAPSISWHLRPILEPAPVRAGRPRAVPPLIQPKLVVGEVNDPLEHEADRMAEAALTGSAVPAPSHPAGLLQRKCAACEAEEQETVRRAVGDGARQSAPAGHRSGPEAAAAAVAGGGASLPAGLRSYFEPRFGHDFSQVRLHDDAVGRAAARSIDARAFTLGADIAFAPGEYSPTTAKGRQLLAHELAHVVQQAGAPTASRLMRQPYPGCDRRTTGVSDAGMRIEDARAQALKMVTAARTPRLDSRSIRLLDRHFHCPSNQDIRTIIASFAAIQRAIPSLRVRCLGGKCPENARASSDGVLEICPVSFTSDAFGGLPGTFIWAAALNAGLEATCGWLSPCWWSFTTPASDMMRQAVAYRGFAIELAGHPVDQPRTIPCRPRNTHMVVAVPPDASDPGLIRPITGFGPSPPPGSRAVFVYEDTAGHKFIYSDSLPGAEAYLPKEPKRFYLPIDMRWSR